MVAIIIAVMGIIGVTTQLVRQPNKEVSIRKRLDSSCQEVFYLISKEYLAWLDIYFTEGIPLSFIVFFRMTG